MHLRTYYHINANTFKKQYKNNLSGFRLWDQLEHADEWLIFSKNIGESICIDETAPSNGELYTIVSNRASRGRKGTIIAVVRGVITDVVRKALMRINEELRERVDEITMDMSNSMQIIARHVFQKQNVLSTVSMFKN